MTQGPIELFKNGVQVFDGEASPAPGGSGVQSFYTGSLVAVADGVSVQLPWTTCQSAVDLLDRSDPTNPVFLATGTYAVSVSMCTDAPLTAGGWVQGLLQVSGHQIGFTATPHPEVIDGGFSACAVAVIDDLVNPLGVIVLNHDGAASRNFIITDALVVKLS